MDHMTSKTIAVFARPFRLPGFDEMLPAGDYDIETELSSPPNHLDPDAWKASVRVQLHPRMSHPGLVRNLTVSLIDLEMARAKDKLTGKALSELYLEEMLEDPMVRLVMKADGVSEIQIRHLYSGARSTELDSPAPASACQSPHDHKREITAIQVAENEGMPPRTFLGLSGPCSF